MIEKREFVVLILKWKTWLTKATPDDYTAPSGQMSQPGLY